MTITHLTVSIGGTEYEVFADLALADEYLAASPFATNWTAASDTAKSKWLVASTRLFNQLPWGGDLQDEDQPLALPRTGNAYLDEDEIPLVVRQASVELANLMANGFDPNKTPTTAQTIRRQKAGSVEIEYFRGAEGVALPIPSLVWNMIKKYMAGTTTIAGALSYGTSGESAFEEGYSRSEPL